MNGCSNLNPFLYQFQIRLEGDVGLDSKLLSCGRVSVCDEVVHNQVVNITSLMLASCAREPKRTKQKECDDGESDRQVKYFLLNFFSERFPT